MRGKRLENFRSSLLLRDSWQTWKSRIENLNAQRGESPWPILLEDNHLLGLNPSRCRHNIFQPHELSPYFGRVGPMA